MSVYEKIKTITIYTALVTLILAGLKIITGLIGSSHALVADGLHSLSDLFIDIGVIIAAKLSHQSADEEHPYGHERVETAASLLLCFFLILTAIFIVKDGITHLFTQEVQTNPELLFSVALIALIANIIIYFYTYKAAKALPSDLLMANALHSQSDIATSVIVLTGVIGGAFGLHWLDSIATLIIGFFIFKMAFDLAKSTLSELIDTSIPTEKIEAIKKIVSDIPSVESIHHLRGRKMAQKIVLDLHLIVREDITVSEGHYIADIVQNTVYQHFPEIQDITIHIDPEDDDEMPAVIERLPLRENLLPLLAKAFEGLPEVDMHRMLLHYLKGKITLELYLPLSLLSHFSVEELQNMYEIKAKHVRGVQSLRLFFY
jgi:cation diffusion facilitator family transporter